MIRIRRSRRDEGISEGEGGGWEGLDIYKILLAEEIFGGNLHDLHTRSN